jgi:hypothetical protein
LIYSVWQAERIIVEHQLQQEQAFGAKYQKAVAEVCSAGG